MLTSASAFAARAARDTWKLDDFLSNDFPTDDDDKLIGTFARPLCYGPGKVKRAQAWASERGIELGDHVAHVIHGVELLIRPFVLDAPVSPNRVVRRLMRWRRA